MLISQVNYNVSSVYDTMYGKRRFNDQLVILQKLTHVRLPLYTKNSVYSVQVIAFTESNERIVTDLVSFNSSDFDNAGLDGKELVNVTRVQQSYDAFSLDAITYFQLRLALPLNCSTWINEVSAGVGWWIYHM